MSGGGAGDESAKSLRQEHAGVGGRRALEKQQLCPFEAEQERRVTEISCINPSDLAIWEPSAHFMTKETFQHYPKSISFITSAICKVSS